MGRTLAIGDIHGHLKALDALLNAVAPSPDDHLVFLGDYVDRGPDSAGVIKRIIELKTKWKVTALRGNHEDMMLAARGGRVDLLREWIMSGGLQTLLSYGGNRATVRDVPAEHWCFLQRELVDYLETQTHIFVHANCDPDIPLSEQTDFVLRWERCDDIKPHQSAKIIVCGHTPQNGGRPMNKGYAICIDTGAGFGEWLTCLDVRSGMLWQANIRGRVVRGNIGDYAD
jgi:serine/threonine protein phosphatase 1